MAALLVRSPFLVPFSFACTPVWYGWCRAEERDLVVRYGAAYRENMDRVGFRVDRRGDLVNAWLKNIEPDVLTDRLDVLGRLTASACQLDMYMDSLETVSWFVRQFREGNYKFEFPEEWK